MEKVIEMYLNYVNKFLTVEKFAEWYGLEEEDANIIIDMGRKYHEQRVELFKSLNK